MLNKIITDADKKAIQEAIRKAEELTSGEIRVHIDKIKNKIKVVKKYD